MGDGLTVWPWMAFLVLCGLGLGLGMCLDWVVHLPLSWSCLMAFSLSCFLFVFVFALSLFRFICLCLVLPCPWLALAWSFRALLVFSCLHLSCLAAPLGSVNRQPFSRSLHCVLHAVSHSPLLPRLRPLASTFACMSVQSCLI